MCTLVYKYAAVLLDLNYKSLEFWPVCIIFFVFLTAHKRYMQIYQIALIARMRVTAQITWLKWHEQHCSSYRTS